MSIKTLLEKAMLRLGCRGAMPGDGEGNILVFTKTEFSSKEEINYVAPADGYINAFGIGQTTDGAVIQRAASNGLQATAAAHSGTGDCYFVPVKKGDAVSIIFWDAYRMMVNFIRASGGGLKTFIINSLTGVRYAYT